MEKSMQPGARQAQMNRRIAIIAIFAHFWHSICREIPERPKEA
jgi:hypothetical protein